MATAARTASSSPLLLVELVDRLEDPQARSHGALGIVLVRHRRPEDRHHGVADELLDGAPEALDLARDARVVRAERGAHVLGVGAVGAGGEADEVDEEHGDDLALLAARRAASSAVPQARQKRARSGFSSPQLGQTITARVYELGTKVTRLAKALRGYVRSDGRGAVGAASGWSGSRSSSAAARRPA